MLSLSVIKQLPGTYSSPWDKGAYLHMLHIPYLPYCGGVEDKLAEDLPSQTLAKNAMAIKENMVQTMILTALFKTWVIVTY